MNEQKHNHHGHGGQNNDSVHYGHRSYWKRAHRDWRFWVGVISMLAAIIIYVMSDDLAGWPRHQRQPPLSGNVGTGRASQSGNP